MSAAVCLLASLLICPYPDKEARLQPSTPHTQSIKRERLGNPPTPILERFGPDKRLGDAPTPILARFGPDRRLGDSPTPIVERFGPDKGFGTTDPQIPISVIFSNEIQEPERQEPRYDKGKEIIIATGDKPRQKPQARTKIFLETTQTKTVQAGYTGKSSLEEQWRLSSLFGIGNDATPTLSQSIPRVSGIDMGKPGYQEVARAAKIHQVPVHLALRVARQESRGNCGAKSPAGALGVMQVMPRTGAKHGYSTKQLINCRTGAEAGVKELKHLLRLSGGDVKQALTGYNCGESCMFGRRKKLPIETVNYIQVVTRN
jgi:hypothetical protein